MADKNNSPHKNFRVLELFSGIGGLHWALKVACVPYEVVAAMEINPTVLETYKFNFPNANVVRKNLEGITAYEINELNIDAIVMSPPCKPFCRTDTDDNRTGPLNHLTQILPEINFKYIFNFQKIKSEQEALIVSRRKKWKESCSQKFMEKLQDEPFCVGDIIDWDLSEEHLTKLKVPHSVIEKYYQAMDIVTPASVCTCCYGHFVKGTGSILNNNLCDITSDETNGAGEHECTAECSILKCDKKICLRYFSPKEISRLMCYPEKFQMPENLSLKHKYKSLGNSVNVYVVAIFFSLLS